MKDQERPKIIFDDRCELCNSAIRFLKPVRPDMNFIPAGTDESVQLLRKHDLPPETTVHSVILIDNGRVFTKSTAVIRAIQKRGGIWQTAGILRLVPVFLRDSVYDWVARNRKRWKQGSRGNR